MCQQTCGFNTLYRKTVRIVMVQNSIGKMPILIDNVAVKKFYYDYCAPLYYRNVDPITNVTFAGINNTSSVDVKSGHEFFLDV